MNSEARQPAREFKFCDQKPAVPDIRQEVIDGLSKNSKTLSPKYFYDELGSRLFEQITRLDEYYPTRTEISILRANHDAIAQAVSQGVCLVEYGSGSSEKIRILLEACRPAAYVPVDISKDHLLESARQIFDDFDWLSVYPTCADYSQPFSLPNEVDGLSRVAFFPGSSIGNFEPDRARDFLAGVASVVGADGYLLIGVDAKKAPEILNRAYNDDAGVTRAFNLNLLTHLNEAVGTDFDITQFDHAARYDVELGRVEMHLVSLTEQRVSVNGRDFFLAAGEQIHTENSYKYDVDEFVALADSAGFACRQTWRDENDYFMVLLLQASSRSERL